MSAPFRSTDLTLTPDDIAHQVDALGRHARTLANAVVKLAFENATGASFDNGDGRATLSRLRAAFEGSIEDLRGVFVEALAGEAPPRGNVPALVTALQGRLGQNELAAGCDCHIERAHHRGAALLAGLPPYLVTPPVPDAHQLGFISPATA
jgi:hypothetical protein